MPSQKSQSTIRSPVTVMLVSLDRLAVAGFPHGVSHTSCTGLTLKAGAEGVQSKLATLSSSDTVAAMVAISEVAETEMGGTSGGLYSIFMSALAKGLLKASDEQRSDKATAEVWARGLEVSHGSGSDPKDCNTALDTEIAQQTTTSLQGLASCRRLTSDSSAARSQYIVHLHSGAPSFANTGRPTRGIRHHFRLRSFVVPCCV